MGLENGASQKHSQMKWKPVHGYENYYLVSENGDVWSIRCNRKLSPKRQKSGYLRVSLSVSGRRKEYPIHRLVASAFVPNPENKPTVNHINENKSDNRACNLSWATVQEQNTHGTRIARAVANTDWAARTAKTDFKEIARKHDYESMNAAQMRKVVQKDCAGQVVGTFKSISAAARSVNVSTAHIWECCNGRRKTCKGSVWNYA